MKNNIKLIIYLFALICLTQSSISDEFEVKSNSIKVTDEGNLIDASGDVEVKSGEDIIIKSKKSILNKKKLLLISTGDVLFEDKKSNIKIKSDKIIFDRLENKLTVKGNAVVILDNNYTLNSSEVIYDKKKEIVFSNTNSTLFDNYGNTIKFSEFNLDLNSRVAKIFNINALDTDKNNFLLEEGFVDLRNERFAGKDLKLFFDKSLLGNSENDPRIFGNSVISDPDKTLISKGVFTSCKINKNEKCPPWEMKAENIKHDKKKKIIEYKNAYLKIYDKPVLYFPFFFHPDPSVKRQSGFLIPEINNSTFLGSSLQIPYYNVISDNKDLTLSPRIFFNDKFLIQSEYRQANKKSDFIVDHSIKYDNQNTITHFFSNFLSNSEKSNYEINLQTVSNRNYLKKYNIQSDLVDNYSMLNSFIDYENISEKSSFTSSVEIFEDLTKQSSDSYEFVYPTFEYKNNLSTNLNGSLDLNISGYQKKYQTNRYDGVLINNLRYNSDKEITKKGFVNNYSILMKNVNSKGNNSSTFKEDYDNKFLSALILNNEYPLKKTNDLYTNFLTPKVSLRISPTETKDIRDDSKRVDYISLFNAERLGDKRMIEGGESLTIGTDYKIKNNSKREIFSFSGGQVFRFDEESDLPKTSTIGNTRSDIIGNMKFSPSDIFNLDYSFSVDKDLEDVNYNYVETSLNVNNLVTSFKFLSDGDDVSGKSYISNTTNLKLDSNNSLEFRTNKNLDKNLTEYYDLIYQYKNDCLTASVEYKKTFYNDVDIDPNENIFFTISIVPFGSINSPVIY